jgi:hypothetical protein
MLLDVYCCTLRFRVIIMLMRSILVEVGSGLGTSDEYGSKNHVSNHLMHLDLDIQL